MMPSCPCKDWQKNLLPWKHFCAAFKLVPGSSCYSLCLIQREASVEVAMRCSWGTLHADCHSPESSCSSTVLRTNAQRPKKCRSLLKELADKVFHLKDGSYKDRVMEGVEDLLEDVRQHTPHDGLLDLPSTPLLREAAQRLQSSSGLQKANTAILCSEMTRKAQISINV